MTLDHRKIELAQEILATSEEKLLDAIDEIIRKFTKPRFKLNLSKHNNIKKQVDVEELKKERPLKDFDMAEFEEEANSLEWDKSINELLAELD